MRERERESHLQQREFSRLVYAETFFRLVYVSVTIVFATDTESVAPTALRFSTQSVHMLHEPVSISRVFLVSVVVAESESCGGLVTALSCPLMSSYLVSARATPKNEERLYISNSAKKLRENLNRCPTDQEVCAAGKH